MPRFLKTIFTQIVQLCVWSARQIWRGATELTRFVGVVLREVGGRAWQHPRTTGVVLGLGVTGTFCQLMFSETWFPAAADVSSSQEQSTEKMTGMDGQLISVLPDVEPAKIETDFPMTALVPNKVTPPELPEFEPILPVASSEATATAAQLASQQNEAPVTTGSQFGTPPWSEQSIPDYQPNGRQSVAKTATSAANAPAAWLTGTIEDGHSKSPAVPATRIAGPWGGPRMPQRN
ncbi:hypothetical protein [Thalassoroseus pseudoceratinae]|uniref:hypothetical protein n=1 Tax=Thalassoroseus pseudoceratinae TaxID=2713176 RepID=UPI001421FAA9|nr:hypothetical protein [Thalassoroseus pseudoceratinae]